MEKMEQLGPRTRRGLAALAALMLLGSLLVVVAAQTPAGAYGTSTPMPIPSVSAGGYMTCGVQADLTAACWGENGVPSNDFAQVHPGGSSTPPAGVQFKEVGSGYATACGIKTDDTIVCWGSGQFNKLQSIPSGTFTHVAPGSGYICAIRTDGTLACWGGSSADPAAKVVTNMPSGQFAQVGVGNHHACALRADGSGTVVCWGHDSNTTSTTRQTVVPAGTYKYVDTSNFDACAIRTDGTAVCWGRGQFGQKAVPAGTFTQLSAGFGHVCGMRPDQTITCWGRSTEGQTNAPPGLHTHVTASTFTSCAMPVSGAPAKCWGNNAAGRIQPILSSVPPQKGYVGAAYSFLYLMANPTEPPATTAHLSPAPTYTVVEGAVPPGLSLSPTGELAGTPSAEGSFTYKVAASNGLSPPDCWIAGGGNLSCTPGDTTSIATATRQHTVVIGAVAPTPGSLTGKVTATGTGAAIVGATVAVAYRDGAPAGQATTDASGNYSVAGLYPETYNVTAGGENLQPSTQSTTITENATTTANFTLGPLVKPTVRVVHLNTWETVTDGLFVEWSEPFEQAMAPATTNGYRIHTQSDCNGTAIATAFRNNWLAERQNSTTPLISGSSLSRVRDMEFTNWQNVVPGNSYFLEVGANTEFGTTSKQRNDRVCVPFTAELRALDRSTVAGTVTDAAGPVAGATVTLTRTLGQPGSVVATATTGANGAYSIPNVAISLFPTTNSFYNKPYDLTATAAGKVAKTSPAAATGNNSTTTVNFALRSTPVAADDAYTATKNLALNVAAPGVLGNDSDVDGDTLTAALVTGPANGTLTLNPDGSFTYTPQDGFTGTDSFGYRASDANDGSATATVTITVTAPSEASADLSVATADTPDPAAKRGTVTYTVTVANAGPSPAASVTVTPALKNGTLRTVTSSQGTCRTSKADTTCSLGTIAAGGSATVTVTATAPTKAGTMSLAAKASSPTPDPNSANNSKTESTTIA